MKIKYIYPPSKEYKQKFQLNDSFTLEDLFKIVKQYKCDPSKTRIEYDSDYRDSDTGHDWYHYTEVFLIEDK